MIFIAHRRNTITDLESTPTEYGVEIDIRSNNGKLIIQHEPLISGEDLEEWLTHYRHGTLILNIKEEGLETPLIKLMDQYKITDYFFLDQAAALAILADVVRSVSNWAQLAQSPLIGMKPRELADFAPAFEHDQLDAAKTLLRL